MDLIADENVDAPIVERLRNAGHSVLYVQELDPGIDDATVLRLANQHHALLLTSDKDIGELVFRQGLVRAGVVLYRLSGLPAARKAMMLKDLIDDCLTLSPRTEPPPWSMLCSLIVR